MKHPVCRLLAILMICLLIPGLAFGEAFHDKADLPKFVLMDYPAVTSASRIAVQFSGADGYTYMLEHQYKGIWLAPLKYDLAGTTGTIQVDCLPGANKFVLRNYGQSRKAKSSVAFTVQYTGEGEAPGEVKVSTPTLRKGDKGAGVAALHKVLADLGVYEGPLSNTFTETTRKAVIAAQKLFGITQDGVVGPQTLHYLNLETYTVPVGNLGGGSTPPQTGGGTSYLSKGSRGEEVKKLQKRLLALGYQTGAADGIFGDITLSAVLQYQKNAKITQDGIVGPVTWSKLNSGAASLVPNVPSSKYLQKGSRGDEVASVQARLITLGYLKDSADGIFGKLTHGAVTAFQKDQGIKVDGIVGPVTRSRLFPN